MSGPDAKKEKGLADWFSAFRKETDARFSVSGYKRIDFSYQKSESGPSEIQRQEFLKLQMSGTVMQTTVNADIQQSSFGTGDDNKSQIEVLNKHFRVKLGEFRASFAAHELMQYTETLDGAEASLMGDGHYLGVVISNPKGHAKKEQFQGNHSQGPFVLQFRPVVPDSESVLLEGVVQKKGQDYTIDYSSGEIRFVSRLIRSEERVVVGYETENLLYKDQVWGVNYGYTWPDSNFGLYYLHKKETQNQGFQLLEQGLGVYQWQSGSWSGVHEGSWSNRVEQVLGSHHGWAFFNKGNYQTPSMSVTVEGLTASDTFVPVSGTGVSPGDYRYALSGMLRDTGARYSLLARQRRQRYGEIQQLETFLQSGTTQQWQDMEWRLGMTHELLSESDAMGAATQAYQRQTGETSLLLPIWGLPFSERIQVERKSVSVGASPSFKSLQSQSRLEIGHVDAWQNIAEATLRWQKSAAATESIEERVFRWTSAYSHSPQNHIQAVAEQRYQTDVFPTTLANMSVAVSPFSEWQQDLKLSLENLKEVYNEREAQVAKWDFVYNTTLRPLSFYETRYTYKTQLKDVDRSGVYPYANHEFSWDNRLSALGAQMSLQRRERSQERHRFDQYPLVIPESSGLTKTTIARFQNRPFPKVTWSLQGEWEDARTETWSIQNSDEQLIRMQRLKSDIAMQIDRHTGGMTVDIEERVAVVGGSDALYQGRYGTYFQFNWLPSTLRFDVAFTHYRDSDSYESYTPSLRYTFRPSSVFDFSVHYSLERIFRSSGIVDNPSWDMSVKAELGRFVLSGTVLQSLKVGSPERFEAYLKMTYLF